MLTKIDTASRCVAEASGLDALIEASDSKLTEDDLTGVKHITIASCATGLHPHYFYLHLRLQLSTNGNICIP